LGAGPERKGEDHAVTMRETQAIAEAASRWLKGLPPLDLPENCADARTLSRLGGEAVFSC
jgi:hypothetical protein